MSFSTYVLHNLVIAAYNARLPPLATGAGPVADALATGALLLPACWPCRPSPTTLSSAPSWRCAAAT
ncbi:hypothetical protein E4O93_07985 [Diaphorobacter sp. DS2]|nr:hypothetical protein E4O93_07985 [Diaphorobacter sp. DS2]